MELRSIKPVPGDNNTYIYAGLVFRFATTEDNVKLLGSRHNAAKVWPADRTAFVSCPATIGPPPCQRQMPVPLAAAPAPLACFPASPPGYL